MRDYLVIGEGYSTITRQASISDAIAFVRNLSVLPLAWKAHENGITFTSAKPRARKILFTVREA